jgi:toxin ParE1/3/4
MSRRVLKRPQAERDLIEHFAFIARDKVEPAERFLNVAEGHFKLLAANPYLGQAWESLLPQLADVRVSPLPGAFHRYLVFYRSVERGIEVLTVLHGSRDLPSALEGLFAAPDN